ncbi:MAG: GNAT family N-acetyltransferase [Chloroflexi bacterium]|nr:GNAT family N-acetyltransferase [Chloroflexota bacterium]
MESRIQSYLRVAARYRRDVEQIGPFLATFTHHSDNPYINYAIPDEDAAPTAAEVAALIEAFELRDLQPRFEYITQLAPAVEPALIAAGFVVESRTPLMICTPGEEQPQPTPPGIEFILPTSDNELLGMIAAQNEAYDAPPPEPEAAPRMRANLADGQIAVFAREIATGEPVGGGVCTVPYQGLTEIAGIGVRSVFRRRGVAAALTVRLTQAAFDAGVTLAFLMAAAEAEERIYARAGFTTIGDVLHISRPRR